MKHRVDTNHKEIVQKLRDCGIQVEDTSKLGRNFPDLIACKRQWVMIELKEFSGKISRGQMQFLADAKGFVGVAVDFDGALKIASDPVVYALTKKDKEHITQYLLRWQGKFLSMKRFYSEVLNRN